MPQFVKENKTKQFWKDASLHKYIFNYFFFSIGHADLELDNLQKLYRHHGYGLMKTYQIKRVEIGHIVCYHAQKRFL